LVSLLGRVLGTAEGHGSSWRCTLIRDNRHIDVRPNWKEQRERPSLTGKVWR
jgi:hypothetical protein